MVSPQPHKLDDVGGASEMGFWNARPLTSPIVPPAPLADYQNVVNKDIIKNPNKRTCDELTSEDETDNCTNSITNYNNNTINVSNEIGDDGLEVVKAQKWPDNATENYEMSSRERGYCLIINNVTFENNVFPARKGSDMDAFRLRKIFKQLGFEVDCKRNLSSEKMQNAFKQKAALCQSKHNALVVILLSHGSEHGVYGVDGIEVNLNDVLSYFDNKHCKTMRGKPKIFIVQACRGRMVDYGVLNNTQQFFSQPESQSNLQPSQLTQINSQVVRLPHWGKLDKDHNPIRTDMVLCFSTQTGYVSNRNEEEGSWLGSSLAMRLCQEAHRRHLMDIFNMVSRDIRMRRSSDGLKQVLEITIIGFDKNLYFNPGMFK